MILLGLSTKMWALGRLKWCLQVQLKRVVTVLGLLAVMKREGCVSKAIPVPRAFPQKKLKSKNPSFELAMEGGGGGSDLEREEEDDSVSEVLRDRFRLSTISIAEAQAKRNGMEISEPIVACIADLAFKYTEQLAKDLELFAQHAGRKSVNMEDVILSAHRNEHLATALRSFCNDLKAKEPQSERKRKKTSRKEDKATTSVVHIPDN